MSEKQGRKIALVGPSGTIGTPTLKYLLEQKIHTITVLQRPESTATYPSEVTVKQGPLTDESFVADALKGQDALVVQLGQRAGHAQEPLLRGAAAAGVPYVLPVEYGTDPASRIVDETPFLLEKRKARELIESLGVSSWIAVISNPWLDYGLPKNLFGINIAERTATLWEGGNRKFSTATVPATARGVAAVLSLSDAELARYRNRPFYVSSLYVTQREIFESVVRATGTRVEDWKVEEPTEQQVLEEVDPKIKQGDFGAIFVKFYYNHFRAGYGGDWNDRVDSRKYGVPDEDLDTVVKSALAEAGVA